MGAKNLETPPRRKKKSGKITLYPPMQVAALYKIGKDNGWDVMTIAKKAVSDALLARENQLQTVCPDEDDD